MRLHKGTGGYKVKALGIAEIAPVTENEPGKTSANNDIVNANIVKAIRECYALANLRSKTKIRTNLAVCSVSGPEVAVRDFSFPPLPPEEIESATILEAEVVCPFNTGQTSVDYQLMSDTEKKTKGIFVAATNTVITNKTQYVKEAGFKCVLMDIDGLALLNCFKGFANIDESSAIEQHDTNTAIMNVGGNCTTLAIINNEGWPFIRDTVYAGNDILKRISIFSDITIEELKRILFEDSQETKFESGELMENACEELITGVTETLRFYATQKRVMPVRKIYVCGGFAGAKGFIELLNRRLGAEAILWNPFDNVHCEVSEGCREVLKKKGYSLAIAAGLAMRSIAN